MHSKYILKESDNGGVNIYLGEEFIGYYPNVDSALLQIQLIETEPNSISYYDKNGKEKIYRK